MWGEDNNGYGFTINDGVAQNFLGKDHNFSKAVAKFPLDSCC